MDREHEQIVLAGTVGPKLKVFRGPDGRFSASYGDHELVQIGDTEEIPQPSAWRAKGGSRRKHPQPPRAIRVLFVVSSPAEAEAVEFELVLGTADAGPGEDLPSWNGVPVQVDPQISGPFKELLDAVHDLDLAFHFEEQDLEPDETIELQADAEVWYRLYRAARLLGVE